MIRTIIIDDEKNALEVLEMQIHEYCKNLEIVAMANGGQAGIEAIRKFNPDLVFLDIEMPQKNGFDVLKETEDYTYKVILTTAYNQFAIKAFKFSALDYLLKPIDAIELQNAVAKVEEQKSVKDLEDKLFKFISKYQNGTKDFIMLPVSDGMQVFKSADIIRCESDGNYTQVYLTSEKRILIAKTLKDIQELLEGLDFIRVHQSHLINMNHIGEGAYVVMSDGVSVSVSRNKKDHFFDQFRKL
jgi:two-component system, LytTR family, response regulator